MLTSALENGTIDLSQPIEIFSQTTKSPSEYQEICRMLRDSGASVTVHDTICSQVASRHERLEAFASSHDAIVFVSGKSSSNGKVLSDLCRSVNPRTYLVGGPSEIDPSWFRGLSTVGVCGATSTPQWLLEQVARAIAQL
jgi:4-hydroxy-3-methylbut-2-enyl diphosphate reductase